MQKKSYAQALRNTPENQAAQSSSHSSRSPSNSTSDSQSLTGLPLHASTTKEYQKAEESKLLERIEERNSVDSSKNVQSINEDSADGVVKTNSSTSATTTSVIVSEDQRSSGGVSQDIPSNNETSQTFGGLSPQKNGNIILSSTDAHPLGQANTKESYPTVTLPLVKIGYTIFKQYGKTKSFDEYLHFGVQPPFGAQLCDIPNQRMPGKMQMWQPNSTFSGNSHHQVMAFVAANDHKIFDHPESSILERIARTSLACQEAGAGSVVFEIPNKNYISTRSKTLNDWIPARSKTLNDWMPALQSCRLPPLGMIRSIKVPVLLIMYEAGRHLSRLENAKASFFIQLNANESSTPYYSKALPQLSTKICELMRSATASNVMQIVRALEEISNGRVLYELDFERCCKCISDAATAEWFPLSLMAIVVVCELYSSCYRTEGMKSEELLRRAPPCALQTIDSIVNRFVTDQYSIFHWHGSSIEMFQIPQVHHRVKPLLRLSLTREPVPEKNQWPWSSELTFEALSFLKLFAVQDFYTLCFAADSGAHIDSMRDILVGIRTLVQRVPSPEKEILIKLIKNAIDEYKRCSRRGEEVFGREKFGALIDEFSGIIPSLSVKALGLLLSNGMTKAKDLIAAALNAEVRSRVDKCATADELRALWSDFTALFDRLDVAECQIHLSDFTHRRLLGGELSMEQVAAWIRFTNTQPSGSTCPKLPVDALKESLLSFPYKSDAFTAWIDLISIIEAESETETETGAMSKDDFSVFYRDSFNAFMCARGSLDGLYDVITCTDSSLLQRHTEASVSVLRGCEFRFNKDSDYRISELLANKSCGVPELFKKIIELIVAKLYPNPKLTDPHHGLLRPYAALHKESQRYFWVQCAVRCAMRMKIVATFATVDSMVMHLKDEHKHSLIGTMLGAWFKLANRINNSHAVPHQTTQNTDVVHTTTQAFLDNYFIPVCDSCRTIFDPKTLANAQYNHLSLFLSHEKYLNELQNQIPLEQRKGSDGSQLPRWVKLVDETTRSCITAFKFMQSEGPFIASLSSFIPQAIFELQSATRFDMSLDDVKAESKATLDARQKEVKEFLNLFSGSSRRFLEHFVLNASSDPASRSVLFRHFMAVEQKRQPSEAWSSVEGFVESVSMVHTHLAKLLHVEWPRLTFDSIQEIAAVLQAADRAPECELQLLANFFCDRQIPRTVKDDVQSVLQLHSLRKPLARLVTCCSSSCETGINAGVLQRFDFTCAQSSRRPQVASARVLIFGHLCALAEESNQQESGTESFESEEQESDSEDQDSDEDYHELCVLVDELLDDSAIASYTATDCSNRLEDLRHLLLPNDQDASYDMLLGMLRLFERLVEAEKVWEFVHSTPEFISPDGEGYSALFNDKVEDFLTQLGGEDYKVLDNFKPVVHWVATLVFNQKKSFRALMDAVSSNAHIREQAKVPPENQPFIQLTTAERNMDFLHALFVRGLDSLDAVMGQYKAITAYSVYVFDLDRVQIRLRYHADISSGRVVELSDADIADFQQRLAFVQHEEKFVKENIPRYLTELQAMRRELTNMYELHALGHPRWSDAVRCKIRGIPQPKEEELPSPAAITENELAAVECTLKKWKAKLEDVMAENQYLSLFSPQSAQHMDSLIRKPSAAYELSLKVQQLFPATTQCFAELNVAVKSAVERLRVGSAVQVDWPTRVSTVLQSICENVNDDIAPTTQGCNASPAGPVRFAAKPSHNALLKLLCHLFSERAPKPFEILWCGPETTARSLEAFLKRVQQHPRNQFVLVQVELLPAALQHVLVRVFLSSRGVAIDSYAAAQDSSAAASSNNNLYCVESGPSLLQSATWIPVLDADAVCAGVDSVGTLRAWAFAEARIKEEELQCVHGASGSGKTHLIRKYMRELPNEVFRTSVSITEAFSIGDVVRKLYSALIEAKDRKLILAFHLNFGMFKASRAAEWTALMARIDQFFFNFLLLHCVEDPESGATFCVPPGREIEVLVELPDRNGHIEMKTGYLVGDEAVDAAADSARDGTSLGMYRRELPALTSIAQFRDASAEPFEIGAEALQVAKYLKAYDDGSIDQLYGAGSGGPKSVMFVLDNSGSMGGGPLETCKRCMCNEIFAKRIQENDCVGLIVFNHGICLNIPMQEWNQHHSLNIRNSLNRVSAEGGTAMWTALCSAVQDLASCPGENKWLVALTDGDSADNQTAPLVKSLLNTGNGATIRVLFITVNLRGEALNLINHNCIKDTSKGDAVVPAQGGDNALEKAWRDVGDRLTVSQRIEKEGANISTPEATALLRTYMQLDGLNRHWSRQKQVHWIRYLYRRCGILAASEKFNKNEQFKSFGSTTMQIMLDEVALALSESYNVDWNAKNHEQFVYCKETVPGADGKPAADYKWSVLATNPDDASDPRWKRRRELLKSLGMQVPTKQDLDRPDRRVLDAYLAHGLGVPLHDDRSEGSSSGHHFDFKIGSLPVLDQQQFVLTLDFTIKLLNINERIECRVPCIMEGETGVSKTALTRMLFYLKNASQEQSRAVSDFQRVIDAGVKESTASTNSGRELAALRRLAGHWGVVDEATDSSVWDSAERLAELISGSNHHQLVNQLHEELVNDPSLDPLATLPEEVLKTFRCYTDNAASLLKWYVAARTNREKHDAHWTFFPVDVHAALTPHDIEHHPVLGVTRVLQRANRLQQMAEILDSERHRKATLCIFYDEVNTSSCMGIFKELLIDHSLNGQLLPRNVVIIAACNPARDRLEQVGDRREELGNQWVTGHYQVHPLPRSMRDMVWDYGSLQPQQEHEFIEKRLTFLKPTEGLTDTEIKLLAKLVYSSQQKTREFAKEHIQASIHTRSDPSGGRMSEKELEARANSVVSLRDILRVYTLFSFFNNAKEEVCRVLLGDKATPTRRRHNAMLLAISIVYYLRLGTNRGNIQLDFRRKFRLRLQSACGQEEADLEGVLGRCMAALMDQTVLEPGIARTRGLQENIFMVVVCCLAQVPLMIVGPPGSSKTLAVTIVSENARGEYSRSAFFKAVPSLIPFHYQCSRQSSSDQIKSIFELAIQRQAKANKQLGNIRCFLFMDEAGLPEEGRESLKVLHYYLEDHMEVDARVGFIAISNHLLDAAKSNRCALLLRAKPDLHELMNVARGCIGSDDLRQQLVCTVPYLHERKRAVLRLENDNTTGASAPPGLLHVLCELYEACMNETPRICPLPGEPAPPKDFVSFFGLRDFMHFLKLLGRDALENIGDRIISRDKIVMALERNMNGMQPHELRELITYFTFPFTDEGASPETLRNPFDLLRQSLSEQACAACPISRYILIIDTSTDDSVLRSMQRVFQCKTLKLSSFIDDGDTQKVNVISQVKWAADQGNCVLLSQTEQINESFYDLFNQHFRKFEDYSEGTVKIVYHTNIAVGAHSRRCKVSKGFQCVVHLTAAELQIAPAPFLNRFEKFRLTQRDILDSFMQRSDLLSELPMLRDLLKSPKIFAHIERFVAVVHPLSFYGYASLQTIESALLLLFSQWKTVEDVACSIARLLKEEPLRRELRRELHADEHASVYLDEVLRVDAAEMSALLRSPIDAQSHKAKVTQVLLAHCIVREVIALLLAVAIPESLFMRKASLPADVIEQYLNHIEHFSLKALLNNVVNGPIRKHFLCTRTSAAVLTLQAGGLGVVKLNSAGYSTVTAATATTTDAVDGEPFALLPFSELTRESQLTTALETFVQSKELCRVLIVVMDASQTPVSQINYARYKIDELFSHQPKPHTHADSGGNTSDTSADAPKSVVVLLHVPASDLHIQHLYDTTFCTDWATTFLDNIDAGSAIPLLKLSADLVGHGSWDFAPLLDGWWLGAVEAAAKFVVLSAHLLQHPVAGSGGMLDKRRRSLLTLTAVPLSDGSSTIRSVLCEKYAELWAGADGNYKLLREFINDRIRGFAIQSSHTTLSDAIGSDIKDMFFKYIIHMMSIIMADQNTSSLLRFVGTSKSTNGYGAVHVTEKGDALNDLLLSFYTDCLTAIPMPRLSELVGPLQTLSVPDASAWTLDLGFPFFSNISRIFDFAAAHALANFIDYEGDDVWQLIEESIDSYLRSVAEDGADPLARLAVAYFLKDGTATENDGLWEAYLNHFVSRMCPSMRATASPAESRTYLPLQFRFVKAWLSSHESLQQCFSRFTIVHAVAQWYEQLLLSLATSIEPLSELQSDVDVESQLGAVIDGDEVVPERLNSFLFDVMYAAMLSHGTEGSSLSSLQTWADALDRCLQGRAQAVVKAVQDENARRLKLMLIVQTLVLNIADESETRHVQRVINTLNEHFISASVGGATEEPNASLFAPLSLWRLIEDQESRYPPAPLTVSLLSMWSRYSFLTGDDTECILKHVVFNSSVGLSHTQRAVALESLILGVDHSSLQRALLAIASSPADSITSWLQCIPVDRRRALETVLSQESAAAQQGYLPRWLRTGGEEYHIADTVFGLIYKWLSAHPSRHQYTSLSTLTRSLELASQLQDTPRLRSIAASAVKMALFATIAANVTSKTPPQPAVPVSHPEPLPPPELPEPPHTWGSESDESPLFAPPPPPEPAPDASVICLFAPGPETDSLLEQLDVIQCSADRAMDAWAAQLGASVCGLTRNADRAVQLLQRWASVENEIVAKWLRSAASQLGAMPSQWWADLQRRFSPWMPLLDSHSPLAHAKRLKTMDKNTSQIIRAVISQMNDLRHLWVLPDLVRMYFWLSDELNKNLIPESQARSFTISSMMESVRRTEGGEEYLRLWTRVKAGVNQFIKHRRRSDAATEALHDELPIWSLLSTARKQDDTAAAVDDLRIDCLHSIIVELVEIYDIFVSSAGVSVNSSSPLVVRDYSDMQLFDGWSILSGINVALLSASADNRIEEALETLCTNTGCLDRIGMILASRLVWTHDALSLDLDGLTRDLHLLFGRGFPATVQIRRKLCRFSETITSDSSTSASAPQPSSSSYYLQTFHSLNYESLNAIISCLRLLAEWMDSREGDDGFITVRDILSVMYPGASEDEYLTRAYIDFPEEEQRSVLLNLPVAEVPHLRDFFTQQLHHEAYLYAHKSISLKQQWPSEVEERLILFEKSHKDLGAAARDLEAFLIRYEVHLTHQPDAPLHKSLAKFFRSEEHMFSTVPLLCELADAVSSSLTDSSAGGAGASSFQFCGAHYVALRRKLREWSASSAATSRQADASRRKWDWPFLFHRGGSSSAGTHDEDNSALRSHFTPWFLVARNENAAKERERADALRLQRLCADAVFSLRAWMRRALLRKQQKTAAATVADRGCDSQGGGCSQGAGRGRSGGRGRGRGRGGGRVAAEATAGFSLGRLIQVDARNFEQMKMRQASVRGNLQHLCTEPNSSVSLVQLLRAALQAAKQEGMSADDEDYVAAAAKLADVEAMRERGLEMLRSTSSARPKDVKAIRSALQSARKAGIAADQPELEASTRLLHEIDTIQARLDRVVSLPLPQLSVLQHCVEELNMLHVPVSVKVHGILQQLEEESNAFASECLHRWGDKFMNQLEQSVEAWSRDPADAMVMPADAPSITAFQQVMQKLEAAASAGVGSATLLDAAVDILEKAPLIRWHHRSAYLALANASIGRVELYRPDAEDDMSNYVDKMKATGEICSPALVLAAARLCARNEQHFRVSCLRRCHVATGIQVLMTDAERRIAISPFDTDPESFTEAKSKESATTAGAETVEQRWERLKSDPDALPAPAVDELMELIGLRSVKREVLDLYESVLAEALLEPERRVPQSHNFCLQGNPGTGKTTVAKIIGKMLHQLKVRSTDKFVETTGEELTRLGSAKAATVFADADEGVLFIDEAYALQPQAGGEGATIAMQLLQMAEEKRTKTTIILAGYKDDIERNLFDFNDGFFSRFNYKITFDDYSKEELTTIFCNMCGKAKWVLADPDVAKLAGRRVARGAGKKGFGNARSVRTVFETAYRRALARDRRAQSITSVDVIGPPPDREQVPELGRALDELNGMIGLAAVKAKIHDLVRLAQVNYERELRGEEPIEVPLNRVFLGNPGTGKTTVAEIYGRVLKGIGFLTDGAVEKKQPSDLMGAHVGDSQKRTASLIKRCWGKVLIIDEAYALDSSSYGKDAIDTLVGLVQGSPGEDIAVVMIGYEDEMTKMFRNQNAGLTRRFMLKDAFVFEDYSDTELERLILNLAQNQGLTISKDVRQAAIKSLAVQRSRPGFGNAGAAKTMIAQAKGRMAVRDPSSRTLTLADLDLDLNRYRNLDDARTALAGLRKVEHIEEELAQLRAVLEQCDRDGKDRSQYLKCYLFLGNQGTGKTTIARMMARLLHEIGVLSRPTIKECSALDLQGSYVGHTKDKVQAFMAEAQGGLLFIDEAYNLGVGTVFAKEAQDELVALMTSPTHLNKTVVVLAGYSEPMNAMMLNCNPGFRSRFTGSIMFPDWEADDCVGYITERCSVEGIAIGEAVQKTLLTRLSAVQQRPGWANARDARDMYDRLYAARALRLSATPAELAESTPEFVVEDAEAASQQLYSMRPQSAAPSFNPAHFAYSGAFAQAAPAPARAPLQRESMVEEMNEGFADQDDRRRTNGQHEQELHLENAPSDSAAAVFAALLEACKEAGYDDSHERRQELIAILQAVQQGDPFPADIMDLVVLKTGLTELKARGMLRPQVHRVLEGMQNAVAAEEEHRAELQRLADEEERRARERAREAMRERLRHSGLCPMGYTWHPCGRGWRCAGGSHYVADIDNLLEASAQHEY